ncbi:MAG: DNA polymerase I [Clostridia bacterium]|nr:DNA polymerase I [Clostridia bacterium]
MKKLLIIDANSIINRAFYGIKPLTSRDGTPTNAVYGFLSILLKLIGDTQPDYICAAFDVKAPTFRHKEFKEYKAQRKPMPDALALQMPIAKEILVAMDIAILEMEGYEADDIIGTVAQRCENSGIECLIATGDKDDLQLATDKTKVILTVTKSGMNETVVYDANEVKNKYSISPAEFIDVKALMGDASDNIPGVAGIGEKTAFSLISKYKSIEYIYEHIDDVGLKGAMLQRMKDGREMAFLSKRLATIDKNVPIAFEVKNLEKFCLNDNARVYEILKRLDLNSIIKRLSLKLQESKEDIFENTQMVVISNKAELFELVERMEKTSLLSLMFFYAGKSLTGISAAIESYAAYIPINSFMTQDDILNAISPVLSNSEIKKMVCDIKDTLVKLSPKVQINGIAYDVAVAAYLLDPARADYNIDGLASEYLNVTIDTGTDASGGKQLSLFGTEDEAKVFCRRVLAISPLKGKTESMLEKNGQTDLYYNVELPLVQVLADMQVCGFAIDKKQLDEFSHMLTERIDIISEQIYSYADEKFNLNSPKQLGVILFEKLGLKAVKKTKTGYSTDVEVLEKLKGKHPIIELLMEYRQLSKLKSTYCDGLLAVIDPHTGRIHSEFKQTVTVTGRISSTEPNMQNIPVRTELGREIRKMFIAGSSEYTLIDADYSQIELRVLAHIANDETMIRAFMTGEDIHAVTASQVFGVPLCEVTSEQRSSAKAVNFGIVYGIGEYSLSQDLKISVSEAKRYITSYLEKYHGVREYMESIKEQAKKEGYVKTLMNRIRYIPELKSSNFNTRAFGERVALNTPIQGTAADIIKLAMVRVHSRLKEENLKSRLILQVHDELIVETYIPEKERVCEILKTEMEQAMTLKVPLVADMSEGKSWYDAK